MTGLIFSCLAVFVGLYHIVVGRITKKGKIRESYCALWIGDFLFSLLGAIITLTVYHFTLLPLLSLRFMLFFIGFLLIAVLFILLSPSGFGIFTQKNASSEETLIHAEYRFNDTVTFIGKLFWLLLFVLPLFFTLPKYFPNHLTFLSNFKDGELCSVFCLIAFLILLPISLRQTFFWFKNITHIPDESEMHLLRMEQAQIYYKRKNIKI